MPLKIRGRKALSERPQVNRWHTTIWFLFSRNNKISLICYFEERGEKPCFQKRKYNFSKTT